MAVNYAPVHVVQHNCNETAIQEKKKDEFYIAVYEFAGSGVSELAT
jgi:hypothetical protein